MPYHHGAALVPARLASIVLLAVLFASSLSAPAAGGESTELFLADGRFRVTAQWTTAQGGSGPGHAVPLTGDTGSFWFFRDSNLELMVKVLDACRPPFDRYWVFAAGLTNVEVELTVEDTVAGTTHTYVNALHTPFEPVQDTSTFATCGIERLCGMGTFAEIQATPRPDLRAERAALAIGGGLTADEDDYQRVVADLTAISEAHPELADVRYDWGLIPNELIVGFTPSVHAQIEAGTYDGWDCLNDWYGATFRVITSFPDVGYTVVTLDGIFDLDLVGEDYLVLPGAVNVGLNRIIPPPVFPPPPSLCAYAEGDTFRYFFDGGTVRYFTSTAGEPPTLVGTHPLFEPPLPEWWDAYESCFGQ